MFRRALVVTAFALAALPAYSANILTRTGTPGVPPTGRWDNGVSTVFASSFTLAAGNPYYAVNVGVSLCTTNGSSASGTAYLTNAFGASATTSNQVTPSVAVTTSKACATDTTLTTSPQTIFTNVTLPAGTYYIVIYESSANLAVAFSSTATVTETPGTGVTANPDFYAATVNTGFPPASTGATTLSPSNGILLSVTGTAGTPPVVTPTGVPTLGTFGFIATLTLLGFSGLLFLKRQTANPLR